MVVEKASNVSQIEDDEDMDEEPGEEIESAPPLKVGEERELSNSGIKKKLLKRGIGWETPVFGDEVTIDYVGTLLDGSKFDSTGDRDGPLTFKLGNGQVAPGLDNGVITMKRGERAIFTLPPDLGFGVTGCDGVSPNSVVQFEVELVSWISVVDVSKDSGIIKKIIEKGQRNGMPSDLDEVLVKYQVTIGNGTVVAESPEEGVEFYVKDGHFCPALSRAILTMKKGERVKLIIQPQYAFGEEGRDANDGCHAIPPNSVLDVDLELISFKPVIDVCNDSKVFKKILKEGEGATADEGASVTISYTARLEDGTIFEKKGIDGEQPLEFITDEEQVIAGLDRVAATMKKGERVLVTISPEYGFGSFEVKRDLATVPPCSKLIYEVELVDLVKEKTPWEMNNQERIEAAGRKKEEGNFLFKNENYKRAAKKYDQAADYVSEDISFGDDEQKSVKSLRVSCWLNGAACSLKLNDIHEAIRSCSKVLEYEFHNVKALYRRAQAYVENGDLVLAEFDVKKATEADPENKEVKLLHKKVKQLQTERNKRDAKLYANMFQRVSNESSVAGKKLKVDEAHYEKNEDVATSMDTDKVADNLPAVNTERVFDSS